MQTTIYSPQPLLRHPIALIREMFVSVLAGRELATRLVLRSFSAKYRQSILGYFWAFFPPIVSAGTFILLKSGGLFTVAETSVPYPVWVLFGTMLWQTFSDSFNGPINQVTGAKAMLIKINFPREALLLAAFGNSLVNFGIRCIIMIAVYIFFPIKVDFPTVLLFPLALLALMFLGMALGLLVTPLAMLYNDVTSATTMALPFLMLFSGAVVPIPPHGLGNIIATWNPIVPVLTTCRDLLTGQDPTMWFSALIIFGLSLVLYFLAWILFRVSLPHLIARMGG